MTTQSNPAKKLHWTGLISNRLLNKSENVASAEQSEWRQVLFAFLVEMTLPVLFNSLLALC